MTSSPEVALSRESFFLQFCLSHLRAPQIAQSRLKVKKRPDNGGKDKTQIAKQIQHFAGLFGGNRPVSRSGFTG